MANEQAFKLSEKLRDRVIRAETCAKSADSKQKIFNRYQQVKSEVHLRTIANFNLASLNHTRSEDFAKAIRQTLYDLETEGSISLNQEEKSQLVLDVVDEMLGLGPIQPYVMDRSVSDILVNSCSAVYVERNGKLELTSVQFRDDEHLIHIINKIVSAVGRRIDEASPMVDARLKDGSRVNAIIPPLAVDGPILSIRKFGNISLTMETLISNQSLSLPMTKFLKACVRAKLNILICGGTGSGKTTLLNLLSRYIPDYERLITIEDSAELQLQRPHVLRLESRPSNIEGAGEVTLRDLVKNSLRMRPDRIVVGEVRGPEALDMLQAMNTGHEGSMSTIHANSSRDALSRLGIMVRMGTLQLSDRTLHHMMASTLHLIVHLGRLSDGKRKILSVSEITGLEGETISLQEIFVFEQKGIDPEGAVFGEFRATGIRSQFSERIKRNGIELDPDIFRYNERAL